MHLQKHSRHKRGANILKEEKGPDGGILPIGKLQVCDVCVNGMFLNYACYFGAPEQELKSIIDFILEQHMPDGGFNCYYNSIGAKHSSLHSTLSVCEGITEYELNGYTYRLEELKKVKSEAIEFILQHHLFLSDRTGEIIRKDFLKLAFPPRWKYNVLRALDYFRHDNQPWDDRMQPAMDFLLSKRSKDGTWKAVAKHPGKTHFEMERAGKPGKWNTLIALRVLKHFNVS